MGLIQMPMPMPSTNVHIVLSEGSFANEMACPSVKIVCFVAGEMIAYQNVRVLHGRTGYEVVQSGTREVEGGNLDLDELTSRRRVLAKKLGLLQSVPT